MSYKPSRCPDCGENVQMCCCQAWAKYTKSGGGGMSDENYQERIEQIRHDRDKYIGMWRSQCTIAEEVMQERDRYKAALAEAMEEAKAWQDRYRKRGYVMDEHAKALKRAEVAEAKLARYKQGVEVEGNYIWWEQCIANVSLDKDKFRGKKVKAFVIPIEESCDE